MKQSFRRSFAALEEVFAFSERFFERQQVDGNLRHTLNFAIEEVFTNWVKYRPGATVPIEVGLGLEDGAVRIELTDPEGEPFDLTQVPDADVNAPLAEREPGGLGMHLVRRMMDHFEFEHDAGTSTVIMKKALR